MQITSEADLANAYSHLSTFRSGGHPFKLLEDPAYSRFEQMARSGHVPNQTVLDKQFGSRYSTAEILWTLKQIAENN